MTVRATTARVFAPAKINLALHVVGQRPDGYHLLDSIVAFADVGDQITLSEAGQTTLIANGPFAAGVPVDERNLVWAALAAVQARQYAITIDKQLPPASGMGGGSSDAGAALRGFAALEGTSPDFWSVEMRNLLLHLGADIPMCLNPEPMRVQGIGGQLTGIELPAVHAVLVNPGVEVSTAAVFGALTRKTNSPLTVMPSIQNSRQLVDWLGAKRNDLETPAKTIAPEIGKCLAALAKSDGCGLARMSGSGATCFGLFANDAAARSAARFLAHQNPKWWVRKATLGDMRSRSAAQLTRATT